MKVTISDDVALRRDDPHRRFGGRRSTDAPWPVAPWPAATHPNAGAARPAHHDASAMVLVPLRLFVGVIWLRSAAEKIVDPAWWDGTAVATLVETQLAAGAVAGPWCAWLAEHVLVPDAQLVGSTLVVLQTLTGLAILLGVATAPFLVVGIAMNVGFLLMGAVNPSAFYIPMQLTLLMGDAGSVAGVEAALFPDHRGPLRRVHEAVFARRRVWRITAGVLAVVTVVAALRIEAFTPAGLVHDPFAVLALVSSVGALGAWIQAVGGGADHRRATADRPLIGDTAAGAAGPNGAWRGTPGVDGAVLGGHGEPWVWPPGHNAFDDVAADILQPRRRRGLTALRVRRRLRAHARRARHDANGRPGDR